MGNSLTKLRWPIVGLQHECQCSVSNMIWILWLTAFKLGMLQFGFLKAVDVQHSGFECCHDWGLFAIRLCVLCAPILSVHVSEPKSGSLQL